MTADSEDPNVGQEADSKAEALLAALEELRRLEIAAKYDYGSRRDSDGLGLFIDAKYTAIWLASAIPRLREFLATNRTSGASTAMAILDKLNSLRNEETPEYGWRHVARTVAETFGLDEETKESWASRCCGARGVDGRLEPLGQPAIG